MIRRNHIRLFLLANPGSAASKAIGSVSDCMRSGKHMTGAVHVVPLTVDILPSGEH